MNKMIKIALSLIVLGIILCIVSGTLSGWNLKLFNSKQVGTGEQITYKCVTDVNSIYVEDTFAKITVKSGDVDNVTVTVIESKARNYDIADGGTALSVVAKTQNRFFGIDTNNYEVNIVVPKDKSIDITVKNTSGRVQLEKLDVAKLSVAATSGSINIYDVTASDIIVAENTSGSIELSKVTSNKDICATNTSGSRKLLNVNADGSIVLNGTSGSTKLVDIAAGKDISIESTSGSVSGTILGSAKDYSVDAKTTSGSNNLAYSNVGSKMLHIHTTSGSIKVEFTE